MTTPASSAAAKPERAWSLWLAVAGLFGLMAIAWLVLFNLAADHPVESVPVEHLAAPDK